MKAIIFGINGQDGYYLKSILEKAAVEVIGVSRSGGDNIVGDVSDREFVKNLISEHKPDFVFHLAANSTVRHEVLFENHESISTGALNVLEAVHRHSPLTKVFLSGSALQFVNVGKPVTEKNAFVAGSPYAVARIHSVYAARYFRTLGIKVYVGYFFHHDSPRRPERHLSMKIAQAALRVCDGGNEVIEIGNVDIVKEFNYAGDIMEAAWILVNQNQVFESVLGSGKGYTIKDWVEICFNKIGKDWTQYTKIKSDFQPEFMSLTSDPSTILSLGWLPVVSIESLADKMMQVRL